jgi:hypothetical protein
LRHADVAHGTTHGKFLQFMPMQSDMSPDDGGPDSHGNAVVVAVLAALFQAQQCGDRILVAKHALDQGIDGFLHRADIILATAAQRHENLVQSLGSAIE